MPDQFWSNDPFSRISDPRVMLSLIKASQDAFQNTEQKAKRDPAPELGNFVFEKEIEEIVIVKEVDFNEPSFLEPGHICEVTQDWRFFFEHFYSKLMAVNVQELVQLLGKIVYILQVEPDDLVLVRLIAKPQVVALLPVEVLVDQYGKTPKLRPVVKEPAIPLTEKQRCISLEEETFMLKDQIRYLQQQKDTLDDCVLDLKASEAAMFKHVQELQQEKETMSQENNTLLEQLAQIYHSMESMVQKDFAGLEEIISTIESVSELQNAMKLAMDRQTYIMELREQKLKSENIRLENNVDHYTVCRVCLDAPKDQLLRPCNHVCCCGTCAQMLSKCPVCRTPIQSLETLYL